MRNLCLLLSALVLFCACSSETTNGATQVVVSVNSDLLLGSELVRIQAELFDAQGHRAAVENRSFELTANRPREGETRIPFSFGITRGSSERFLLVLTGYGIVATGEAEVPVIEQKVIASFQDQQTLLLKLFLGRPCFRNLCDDDTTCYLTPTDAVALGACGAIPERTGLPRVKPGNERDAWLTDGGFGADEDGGGSSLDGGSQSGDGGASGLDGSQTDPDGAAEDASSRCPAGYAEEGDGCADINECATNNGGCAQSCANSNGSFACSCGAGYGLAADMRACNLFTWGPAATLDTTMLNVTVPSIAVDAYGNAIAIWTQIDTDTATSVWSSRYDGSTWDEPAKLSGGSSANGYLVASNGRGDVVAVYSQDAHLWARRYVVGQRWLPAVQLENTAQSTQGPIAVVDADGNIIVAWIHVAGAGGTPYSARFDAGTNTWSAAGALGSAGLSAVIPSGLALALGSNGVIWASWAQFDGSAVLLRVNRFVPGQGWAASSTVANSGAAGSTRLVVDAAGVATVLFSRNIGSDPAAMHWTSCQTTLSCTPPASLGTTFGAASLAIDSAGTISAVWAGSDGSLGRIMWTRKAPGQNFGTPMPISVSSSETAAGPDLVVDASGTLVAVWQELTGEGGGTVWYARFVANSWSRPTLLQSDAQSSTSWLSAEVDGAGHVFSIWTQYDGERTNITSRRLQ